MKSIGQWITNFFIIAAVFAANIDASECLILESANWGSGEKLGANIRYFNFLNSAKFFKKKV